MDPGSGCRHGIYVYRSGVVCMDCGLDLERCRIELRIRDGREDAEAPEAPFRPPVLAPRNPSLPVMTLRRSWW